MRILHSKYNDYPKAWERNNGLMIASRYNTTPNILCSVLVAIRQIKIKI
jgi:hypothetical protein